MDTYVIKKAEIDEMNGVEKQHFMNANAERLNKSLGDVTGLTGIGFHIIDIAPGKESTEHHRHHHEDECVYVLSGCGVATIGEEDVDIAQGDFLGFRAGGLAHSMKNTGTETLRCIVVGQRLPHDVGDYPRQNKRIFRNVGMPWQLVDLDDLSYPKGGGK